MAEEFSHYSYTSKMGVTSSVPQGVLGYQGIFWAERSEPSLNLTGLADSQHPWLQIGCQTSQVCWQIKSEISLEKAMYQFSPSNRFMLLWSGLNPLYWKYIAFILHWMYSVLLGTTDKVIGCHSSAFLTYLSYLNLLRRILYWAITSGNCPGP